MKVYALQGQGGLHDDFHIWVRDIYLDRDKAQAEADKFNKEADYLAAQKEVLQNKMEEYESKHSGLYNFTDDESNIYCTDVERYTVIEYITK